MTEPVDLVLRNGDLASGGGVADVAVSGGEVVAVGPGLGVEGASEVDLDGALVSSGFIDLQVNGAWGHDFTDDPEGMWPVGERLREHGVTAFLATLVSTDLEVVNAAREVVCAGPPDGYRGARVLGLHVEGPFLSPERCGAHDPAKLQSPHPDLVAGWSPATGVRLVTLAPELPGALGTIAALSAHGVVVSAGHSNATYEEARAGIDAGVTMVTHLFNAMSGIDHRNPGLAAAALADPRVTAALILDLIHVKVGAVRAAWAALGTERTLLVTDISALYGAESLAGLLGGQEITIGGDGVPRLASGVLAGTALSMDLAVRNHVAAIDAGLAAALEAVTTVPARLLGLEHGVAPGLPADLTILDEGLKVIGTVVAGDLSDRLR